MKDWKTRDTALLLVRHSTRFVYAEPVVEAHSEVRKTPRDAAFQRVLTHKLEVWPVAALRQYTDYFGSHVHAFNLLEPHDGLEIRAEAVVETRDQRGEGPETGDDPRPWRSRLAEYLHPSPLVPALPEYASIAHRVDVALPPEAFLDALRELASEFRRRFRYDPEATDVHSSPKALFEAGGGVCQDLTHAMIGVLRLAGVPARYRSGYVYDAHDEGEGDALRGARASHAWVEAWHPQLRWVGVDPTNDRLVDWQYVRVAAGRDYGDVQPLRGVFVGSRQQELRVDVAVERIG